MAYISPQKAWDAHSNQELRITIAGADRNEGMDAEETAARFTELTRLVAAAGVRRMRLLLAGPNIARSSSAKTLTLDVGELLEHSTLSGAPSQPPVEASWGQQQQQQQQQQATEPQTGTAHTHPEALFAFDSGSFNDYQLSPHRSGWWQATDSSRAASDCEGGTGASAAASPPRPAAPSGVQPCDAEVELPSMQGPTGRAGGVRVAGQNTPLQEVLRQHSEAAAAAALTKAPAEEALASPAAVTGRGGSSCCTDPASVFTLRICYAPAFAHAQESLGTRVGADLGDLDSVETPPHLLACFNAGVWGYGASWLSTCAHATQVLRTHVVFTAYCREEAEDDFDCIEEAGFSFLWDAEENPFKSLRPWGQGNCYNRREAVPTIATEQLAENSWWMCVAPDPQ